MKHSEGPELELAHRLVQARQAVSPIPDLPAGLVPSSEAAGNIAGLLPVQLIIE